MAFLADAPQPVGILGAKTVGEPPLMYGIGAYFAILDALRAFRPDLPLFFQAPMTNEKRFGLCDPETGFYLWSFRLLCGQQRCCPPLEKGD